MPLGAPQNGAERPRFNRGDRPQYLIWIMPAQGDSKVPSNNIAAGASDQRPFYFHPQRSIKGQRI